MKTTAITVQVTCDRKHFRKRTRSATAKVHTEATRQLEAIGWWVGRKHVLCPQCAKAEGKKSQKGRPRKVAGGE